MGYFIFSKTLKSINNQNELKWVPYIQREIQVKKKKKNPKIDTTY